MKLPISSSFDSDIVVLGGNHSVVAFQAAPSIKALPWKGSAMPLIKAPTVCLGTKARVWGSLKHVSIKCGAAVLSG